MNNTDRRRRLDTFDYEKKVWGSQTASLSIFNSYCLSVKYGLESIAGVKGKVLDVGCGAGAFTAALKLYRSDLSLVGLDFSQRCIQMAKQKHKEIKFVQGNVDQMPFKNESFDAVVSNHLLEHLDEPKAAVVEIYRVLKPKGVFYSSTPLEGNWSSLVRWLSLVPKFRENRLKYLGHTQSFNKEDYLKLLEGTGLAIKEVNWSGFITYQVIDTVYYPLLQILGKEPEYLAEVAAFESDRKIFRLEYTLCKGLTNLISNLESLVLRKLPGFIIHAVAIK